MKDEELKMDSLFALWVLAEFDWCTNITRVAVWLSLNFVAKVLQMCVRFDLFQHVVGFVHLTCEEACEKIALICRYDRCFLFFAGGKSSHGKI